MRWDILSLFPEYFHSPFQTSILKRAIEKKLIEIELWNLREFSSDRWQRVDDRPYGGGPGMILMAEPLIKAIRSIRREETRVIYLSPQGKILTPSIAKRLAQEKHLLFVCGHYEGIDERVIEKEVDEEISIGDYVLSNGCLAALVLGDVVARFIPGVLGHSQSAEQDSFQKGFFDTPHYTKPFEFEGVCVPEILLSGHHQKIFEWREKKGKEKTALVRPDLKID
jgi:tRNA (guanine37-N1)-methyltransferase